MGLAEIDEMEIKVGHLQVHPVGKGLRRRRCDVATEEVIDQHPVEADGFNEAFCLLGFGVERFEPSLKTADTVAPRGDEFFFSLDKTLHGRRDALVADDLCLRVGLVSVGVVEMIVRVDDGHDVVPAELLFDLSPGRFGLGGRQPSVDDDQALVGRDHVRRGGDGKIARGKYCDPVGELIDPKRDLFGFRGL